MARGRSRGAAFLGRFARRRGRSPGDCEKRAIQAAAFPLFEVCRAVPRHVCLRSSARATEWRQPMKRSGDVTASAIILFFGSGLITLVALLMLLGASASPLPPEQRVVLWVMPILYVLVTAWGIATGVGILPLRPWAWVSVIVMSGVTIFFGFFGAVVLMFVPSLLKDQPDVPAASVKIIVFVGLVMVLIPIAIAIWWLVLFTRARVRLQFAKRGAALIAPATPEIANPSDLARRLNRNGFASRT